MTITLPLVLVLGIGTTAAVKFLGIRLWVAALIALFGFYLAGTFIAPAIDGTTKSGVDMVNHTQK
ncbi:hypothetical protein GCM10009665_61470 [Kitasatospora nipponensis]|uniref:Uncharacterized protein n=1 Tax=Kitasatospora nipponensis TaxID=258049 RepID=A0ABN1WTJ5_9ACTN